MHNHKQSTNHCHAFTLLRWLEQWFPQVYQVENPIQSMSHRTQQHQLYRACEEPDVATRVRSVEE